MKFVSKIFIFGLSIVIFLTGAELFLRLINYPYQNCKKIEQVNEARIGVFDPDTGWAYENNTEKIGEYGTLYAFTKEGYRASHSAVVRDTTKPVILVVGDSMLFGHGLPFEDSFSNVLSNKLDNKYEVLNFSVQAFGTDQMYVRLKKLLPIYKPKLVIISYLPDHDQRNMSEDRRDFFPCHTFPGTKPRFEVKDGKLVQVHFPSKEEKYDEFRIRLLFQKISSKQKGTHKQLSNDLSHTLVQKIQSEVEAAGASPVLIAFSDNSNPPFQDLTIQTTVVKFFTDGNPDNQQYFINPLDHHPNRFGEEKLVEYIYQTIRKHL